jgi:predicted ABC-type ATPase
MPDLIIIGGPNGAGKSTLFPAINNVVRIPNSYQPNTIQPDNYVNTDDIAAQFKVNNFEAGKLALSKIDKLLDTNQSLAIESTLACNWPMSVIAKAQSKHYRIYIIFVIIESPELSMARVTQRALLGKHYIPWEDIQRRYGKALYKFNKQYQHVANFWMIIDNSGLKWKELAWGGQAFRYADLWTPNIENYKYLQGLYNRYGIPNDLNTKNVHVNSNPDFMDRLTPEVIQLVQNYLDQELQNRPIGNYVAISENFTVKFTQYKPTL